MGQGYRSEVQVGLWWAPRALLAPVAAILILAWVLLAHGQGFDGERPALPEDYGIVASYQSTRCAPSADPYEPLNAMAYGRISNGLPELLVFCLHRADDWLSPMQDPRLYQFSQCWMRPPGYRPDSPWDTSGWCHEKVMPDGQVLSPSGTAQVYAWTDAQGRVHGWCDLSCHWPGDAE